jgi:hypothetical protein
MLLHLLALLAFAGTPQTDLERQRLVAHFEMTESWLADESSHLSDAQLHFRATPTSWNVLDCVEHLDLAEANYWAMFKKAMAAPASKGESPSEDIDRIWYGIDRTERATTVASETPHAKFKTVEPALAEFRANRAAMLAYIKTTKDDLRHHQIPEWDRDGYQWLLMVSAHAQRHILQIREIKHNQNFPQK